MEENQNNISTNFKYNFCFLFLIYINNYLQYNMNEDIINNIFNNNKIVKYFYLIKVILKNIINMMKYYDHLNLKDISIILNIILLIVIIVITLIKIKFKDNLR